MQRTGLSMLVGVPTLALLLLGPGVRAAQPDMLSFQVDSTRTIPSSVNGCGFDTVRHSEGTFYVTIFYDNDGKDVREVWRVSSYTVTDSNPLNGKSVTSVLAGPFILTPNEDGTVTVTIPGNDGNLTAAGEGVLWSNVGLIVYTADPEDPFTPLSVSALHGLYTDLNGPYPEACSALS